MLSLGRPVSLNRENIANLSLKFYWKQGLNNISYNNIIKLTKFSKGSFYKLFFNQDDLHAETLLCYYDYISKFMCELSACDDLFEFLNLLKKKKYKHDMKFCYFFSCYSESYNLGKKTKKVLEKIKKKYKAILNKIIRKHIDKKIGYTDHINVEELTNYYFNSFIIVNLLIRNDAEKSEINLYKKTLLRFTTDLNQKYKH